MNCEDDAPLVSVVIPTFNRAHMIDAAIDSVESQTYTHWELHIVDDLSTDHTPSIILERGASNPNIQYHINDRTKGVSGARNCGIDKAHGKYLAFLDSDDIWVADHLASAVDILESHTEIGLYFGNRVSVDATTGNSLGDYFAYEGIPEKFDTVPIGADYHLMTSGVFDAFLKGNVAAVQTAVIPLAKLGALRFDESLLVAEDRDFFLRYYIEKRVSPALRVSPCVKYIVHNEKLSHPTPENSIRFIESHLRSWSNALRDFDLSPTEKAATAVQMAKEQLHLPYLYRKSGQYRKALASIRSNASTALPRRTVTELVKVIAEWVLGLGKREIRKR